MAVRDAAAALKVRFAVALIAVLWVCVPAAERFGYSADEFAARRQRLARALQRGTLVMFGATSPTPGIRFRQDNDFFYLTGNEDLNAALVMDAASAEAHLFLPKLGAAEVRFEGPNWLEGPDAARTHGFASVQPITAMPEFLARRRAIAGAETLWTRLVERDAVNYARGEIATQTARRLANPFGQYRSEDAQRTAALRDQFPYFTLQDATPHLDRLRMIKTPREIEILR